MKRILKFYSETCAPCKVMGKRLAELKNVEIQEVNINDEDNESLLDEWKIRAVPTIIVLEEDNTLLQKFSGITPIEKIQGVIDGGQTATT